MIVLLPYVRYLGLAITVSSFAFWVVSLVYASDCPPGGYADCANAATTAQNPLVPVGGAILGVILNGAFQGETRLSGSQGGEDNQGKEDVRYTLDLRTEEQRMSLVADGEDRLWVYAKLTCSKPAVNAQALTSGLDYSIQGEYASWVSVEYVQMNGGYKAARLLAKPPTPDAELPDDAKITVLISGSGAEGESIQAPITIQLEGELQLKVSILE